MSTTKKETVIIPVETVDNWSKTLSYIMTTLDFWVKDVNKKWPLNLCYDGLNDVSNEMFEIIHSVSVGHINDK